MFIFASIRFKCKTSKYKVTSPTKKTSVYASRKNRHGLPRRNTLGEKEYHNIFFRSSKFLLE
jgi:hypothetical protein